MRFHLRKNHFYSVSSMDIFTLPSTEEDAVAFLQDKGILPDNQKCGKEHGDLF